MRLKELIYRTVLNKRRIRIVGNHCEDLPGVEIDFHTAWSLVDAGVLNGRCYVQPALPYGLVYHNDALDTRSHWSERMIAQLIGAELAPPRTPGYDAILPDGRRVQIKCASWYIDRKMQRRAFNLNGVNKRIDYDVLIVALADPVRPNDPTAFDFFVLGAEVVREITKNVSTHVCVHEAGSRFKWLQKYRHNTHGLRHFFGLSVEETINESPQPIIDLYVKQPYDVIPYDPRYEADDFYVESVVAHLTNGTITEQNCPGHDVVMHDGTKVSVKKAQLSHNMGGSYRFEFWGLYDDAEYDLLAGVFWSARPIEKTTLDARAAGVILLPKIAVAALKENGKNKRVRFTPNDRSATYQKIKPFIFSLAHIAELGATGYAKFYEKYLREPTEAALRRYAS